jgi:hypothetical protein
MSKFDQAIAKIDAINAADPTVITVDGHNHPQAAYHAVRRTSWVHQLRGETASEPLLLAARAQHLKRWTVPRNSYPEGRIGYLKWRTDLKQFHAETTAQILEEVGYPPETIKRVKDLISKKNLKQDPDTQTLEDALCLVFLETQFTDFATKEADKISNIIQKTWRKMSPQGQQAALQLPLMAEDVAIIQQAVSCKL